MVPGINYEAAADVIPRTGIQTRDGRDMYVYKYCCQVYVDVLWPVYAT